MKRLDLLDLLRLICILLIVLFHCWMRAFKLYVRASGDPLYSYIQHLFLVWGAHISVSVFIVISGLSLAYASSKLRPLAFYQKRVARIYIPFIVAQLIYLPILFKLPSVPDLLLSFTGFNVVFPGKWDVVSIHFWFIGMIIQLYLLFPFLRHIQERMSLPVFVSLCIGLSVITKAVLSALPLPSDYLHQLHRGGIAFSRLGEFGIGMALGATLRNNDTLTVFFELPKSSVWKVLANFGRDHSYSLYLIHYAFAVLIFKSWHTTNLAEFVLKLAMFLPLVCLLSILFTLLTEFRPKSTESTSPCIRAGIE